MKRLVLFLMMAILVLGSSAAAMAIDPPDGKVWDEPGYSGDFINEGPAGYGDRLNNQGPRLLGNQGTTVTVPVEAFLPCYLELEIKGNWGKVTGKSFGANTLVTGETVNSSLAFWPGIGGYVNDDWALLENNAFSYNAEVAPADGVWIRGCDVFTAKVYSNLNYAYSFSVLGKGLTRISAPAISGVPTLLPIDGRAKFAVGDHTGYPAAATDAWAAMSFDATGADAVWAPAALSGNNATKHTVVWHQFRVPYTREYAAGEYAGHIVFSAKTI